MKHNKQCRFNPVVGCDNGTVPRRKSKAIFARAGKAFGIPIIGYRRKHIHSQIGIAIERSRTERERPPQPTASVVYVTIAQFISEKVDVHVGGYSRHFASHIIRCYQPNWSILRFRRRCFCRLFHTTAEKTSESERQHYCPIHGAILRLSHTPLNCGYRFVHEGQPFAQAADKKGREARLLRSGHNRRRNRKITVGLGNHAPPAGSRQ